MRTLLIVLAIFALVRGSEDGELLDGSFVTEQRGYFKREHSLIKPYQGNTCSPTKFHAFSC
jgi:hypothetical protein